MLKEFRERGDIANAESNKLRKREMSAPTAILLRLELRDDVALSLLAYPEGSMQEHVLFQGQYDPKLMLEWLRECESKIRHEEPLISQTAGETIGQTLARSYDAVSDDLPIDVIDIASEALYQYNFHHNVVFGAPGMDIPRLLLGKGSGGHEICNWIDDLDQDTAWRYLFDPDDFFSNLPAG